MFVIAIKLIIFEYMIFLLLFFYRLLNEKRYHVIIIKA